MPVRLLPNGRRIAPSSTVTSPCPPNGVTSQPVSDFPSNSARHGGGSSFGSAVAGPVASPAGGAATSRTNSGAANTGGAAGGGNGGRTVRGTLRRRRGTTGPTRATGHADRRDEARSPGRRGRAT